MIEKEFNYKEGRLGNITRLYLSGVMKGISREDYFDSPPVVQLCYDIIANEIIEYQRELNGWKK
ncbi:hypothetical protein [Methanobrevibacter arboriphilus]|uniref:Uncharacterized protein n=1 Tax=Methanobrevibacter arboriphilus TaxID=39441 RepID=A0ACA8R530_METAZ|nr:hypothetical protein [Methanobrevibacter arboriphilus]BBL62431.1 hypothetical protein MarbSA_14710 [Methanobrevibacter arboriphilus]